MRSKLLDTTENRRTLVVVLDTGDELVITESPRHLQRRQDEETGLALLEP